MGGRGSGSGGMGRGFTFFADTAEDGYSYRGDGQEQVDFFKANSNYDELIENMSPDERDAFRAWTRGTFMSGQQYRGVGQHDW